MTTDEVVARLKAADVEDFKDGEAGEGWVEDSARPRELRALVAFARGGNVADKLLNLGAGSDDLAHSLMGVIDPRSTDVVAFWEGVIPHESNADGLIRDNNYAAGFVSGALRAWLNVRNQV